MFCSHLCCSQTLEIVVRCVLSSPVGGCLWPICLLDIWNNTWIYPKCLALFIGLSFLSPGNQCWNSLPSLCNQLSCPHIHPVSTFVPHPCKAAGTSEMVILVLLQHHQLSLVCKRMVPKTTQLCDKPLSSPLGFLGFLTVWCSLKMTWKSPVCTHYWLSPLLGQRRDQDTFPLRNRKSLPR